MLFPFTLWIPGVVNIIIMSDLHRKCCLHKALRISCGVCHSIPFPVSLVDVSK